MQFQSVVAAALERTLPRTCPGRVDTFSKQLHRTLSRLSIVMLILLMGVSISVRAQQPCNPTPRLNVVTSHGPFQYGTPTLPTTVTYRVIVLSPAPTNSGDFTGAVVNAFNTWSTANTSNGSWIKFVNTTPTLSGDITVILCNTAGCTASGAPGDTKGVPQVGCPITGARIEIDLTKTSKVVGSPPQLDTGTTFKLALHEIGHTMGLDDQPTTTGVEGCGMVVGGSVMNVPCLDQDHTTFASASYTIATAPTSCDNNTVSSFPGCPAPPPPPSCTPSGCGGGGSGFLPTCGGSGGCSGSCIPPPPPPPPPNGVQCTTPQPNYTCSCDTTNGTWDCLCPGTPGTCPDGGTQVCQNGQWICGFSCVTIGPPPTCPDGSPPTCTANGWDCGSSCTQPPPTCPDGSAPTCTPNGWDCGSTCPIPPPTCPDGSAPTCTANGWDCGSSCTQPPPTCADGSDPQCTADGWQCPPPPPPGCSGSCGSGGGGGGGTGGCDCDPTTCVDCQDTSQCGPGFETNRRNGVFQWLDFASAPLFGAVLVVPFVLRRRRLRSGRIERQ
jgi:hypothetical protein